MSPTEKSSLLAMAGLRATEILAQLALIKSELEITIIKVVNLQSQLRMPIKPEQTE